MNPLNFLRQSYITGCRVYSSLQTMYLITVPQSLVLGSKCYSYLRRHPVNLWNDGMVSKWWHSSVSFLFHFVFLDLIWVLSQATWTGPNCVVSASVSIKKATGYIMGLWMRKYELAKRWSCWSYVPIILRNWLSFFSETLLRKYIEGIRDSVLTKCFYL